MTVSTPTANEYAETKPRLEAALDPVEALNDGHAAERLVPEMTEHERIADPRRLDARLARVRVVGADWHVVGPDGRAAPEVPRRWGRLLRRARLRE